nr:hypothetical protein [Angustibacter aerolatus]
MVPGALRVGEPVRPGRPQQRGPGVPAFAAARPAGRPARPDGQHVPRAGVVRPGVRRARHPDVVR